MFYNLVGFILIFASLSHHIFPASSLNCLDYTEETDCTGDDECVWVETTSSCACGSDARLDIVFALDASTSVTSSGWSNQLTWLSDFVQNSMSPSARLGIIRFATQSQMLLNFTDFEAYTSKSDLVTFIQSISYTAGSTNTMDAIEQSIVMFDQYGQTNRNKMLMLITDGQPYLNGAFVDKDTFCGYNYKDKLINASVETFILAVGPSIDTSKIDCIYEQGSSSSSAASHIFDISSYDPSDFSEVTKDLELITRPCPFEMIVTEVKPHRLDCDDCSADTRTAGFIELYNPSSAAISLSYLNVSGLMFGDFSSHTGKVVPAGYYLVLYDSVVGFDGSGNNVSCSHCDCTLQTNGHYCQNAIYVSCGDFFAGESCFWNIEQSHSEWSVFVYDTRFTGSSALIDSVIYDTDSWEQAAVTHSWELKDKTLDNSVGSNWFISCQEKGTPGAEPITGCLTSDPTSHPTSMPTSVDGGSPIPVPTKSPSIVGDTAPPTKSPTMVTDVDIDNSDNECVSKCYLEPCGRFENQFCCDYETDIGCNSCEDGYWQLTKNHKCVSCYKTLGDACIECEDYKGCVKCDSKHELYYDQVCNLWACRTTQC